MRVRAVAELGSYEMLHPDDLGPEAMRAALARLHELPIPDAPPDAYEGADRSAAILAQLAHPLRVVPPALHPAHDRRAGSRHRPGGNPP